MKHQYLPTLLAIGFLSAEEPEGALSFDDRTTISGQISSYDPENQSVEITSPSLDGKVALKTNRLLEFRVEGMAKAPKSDHYAIATINNYYNDNRQDTIRGRLVNLDDESITLDTWYAGELTLRRSMVTALDVYPQSPSFYDGPNGLDGWVPSSGDIEDSWKYADRSLISLSRTGIAREIKLPDRSMISCRVDWKSSAAFYIFFLSDTKDTNYLRKGYSLSVRRSYFQLNRTGSNNERANIFSKSTTTLSGKESANIRIYLDRRKDGKSAVFIDNELLTTWTDQDDTQGLGDWLHFVPQSSYPMKVSQISITQWDGSLPVKEDESEKSSTEELLADLEGQTILLSNGDILKGTITKIEDGNVSLETSFGDIELPVKRMSSVSLGNKDDLEQPRRWTGDVRAWFKEGGYITMDLKSFDGKSLHGKSQVFKDAKFDTNAFSKIEFNIWDNELNRYGPEAKW